MADRIKLPKPAWATKVRFRGITFFMEAPNPATARKWAKALHRDMRESVRLTNAFTFGPGIVGVGHAGIAQAKREAAKKAR